jgi:ubiquinone biosynthesis protein
LVFEELAISRSLMLFFGSKKRWKKLKRSRQIILVFLRYGMDHFIDRTKINFSVKIKRKKESYPELSAPKRLRLALEELGPTFVKFGQILSTRPDLVPPSYIKELEKLQDEAFELQPFSASKVIRQEWGKNPEDLFQSFENKPISTASLSQVHRAVLPTGENVAVKVQRPNIKETIQLDMDIMEDLTGVIRKNTYNSRNYHPKLILDEFRRAINKELDFTFEGYNLEKFRNNLIKLDYIKIPEVHWDWSNRRILTMEFITGEKISKISEKDENTYDKKELADNLVKSFLKQALEDGFFHADPHPANILVQKPNKLVFLDVGMVGYLDEKTATQGARLLQALTEKNFTQTIRSFKKIGVVIEDGDQVRLRQDLREITERYMDMPLKHLEIKQITQDILQIMTAHNLAIPSNLTLLIKALSMIETNAKQLDPDFNMIKTAKPFTKELIRKKMGVAELFKKGRAAWGEGMELMEELPENTIDILEKIQDGKLVMNFQHQGLDDIAAKIEHFSNRTSFSLIIASLIVGSALVLQQEVPPMIFGYSAIGIVGYLLAAVLGLGLVISILKSAWKNK